jgi:hypothetical protein
MNLRALIKGNSEIRGLKSNAWPSFCRVWLTPNVVSGRRESRYVEDFCGGLKRAFVGSLPVLSGTAQ